MLHSTYNGFLCTGAMLYDIMGKHSLARGLEEWRKFKGLLTESVGRVHFSCLSCLFRNIRIKFVGHLIFPAKVNRGTVRLTSTGNPVPGNREFRLAPSETIVGQVKKIRSLTQGID